MSIFSEEHKKYFATNKLLGEPSDLLLKAIVEQKKQIEFGELLQEQAKDSFKQGFRSGAEDSFTDMINKQLYRAEAVGLKRGTLAGFAADDIVVLNNKTGEIMDSNSQMGPIKERHVEFAHKQREDGAIRAKDKLLLDRKQLKNENIKIYNHKNANVSTELQGGYSSTSTKDFLKSLEDRIPLVEVKLPSAKLLDIRAEAAFLADKKYLANQSNTPIRNENIEEIKTPVKKTTHQSAKKAKK